MKLKYFWHVEYRNGATIKQFQNGEEIMWKDVDESQIKKISWVKRCLFYNKTKASITLNPGDTPMICRRTHIGIGVISGKETGRKMEYLLGKNGEYTIKVI